MSEPVAFEYQHEETGVIGYIDQWQIDNGFFDNNPRLQLIGPLYRHPPKADLEAENAKLREALETIRDSGLEPIDPAYRRLATDALQERGSD